MSDTALRYLAMLRMIPRYPQRISTAELHKKLQHQGFLIDVRSVQRNLSALSAHHEIAISSETQGAINYWFWPAHSKVFDMPVFSVSQALAIRLIADYGPELLPAGFLDSLGPYVERADEALTGSVNGRLQQVADWRSKVHMIRSAPVLHPPAVDPNVVEPIYMALMEGRRLSGRYRSHGVSEPRRILVDPLGLVVKQGVSYLVAVHDGYEDCRHHALHRFTESEVLDAPVREFTDFNLANYAAESFSYPEPGKQPCKLVLAVSESLAEYLEERPLSDDQLLKQEDEDWFRCTATVSLNDELHWWLLSFGDQVKVIRPLGYMRQMRAAVTSMYQLYAE